MAVVQPGTDGGLCVPPGLAGDTGTPGVLPVPIARLPARMQTHARVALLGDGGDFLGAVAWISEAAARRRVKRDKGPGTRRARNKTKHQMVSTSA